MPQKMQTDMLRSVGRDQFSDIRLVVAGGVQVWASRSQSLRHCFFFPFPLQLSLLLPVSKLESKSRIQA